MSKLFLACGPYKNRRRAGFGPWALVYQPLVEQHLAEWRQLVILSNGYYTLSRENNG